MAIDYSKLRQLTARSLMKALKKDGFWEESRKGVTRFFAHPDGRTTTIHLGHLLDLVNFPTLRIG